MNVKSILEKDAFISARLRLGHPETIGFRLAALLAHSGDSWFWLLGLFILWSVGNSYWHDLSAVFGIGIGLLAVLVFSIKILVRRRRPEGEWGAIYRNTDPHSFPSGHAARAMMLVVAAFAIGPVWLGVILFIWAPSVSLARVMMGVHYVSDIVAGTILGLVAGLVLVSLQPVLVKLFPFVF